MESKELSWVERNIYLLPFRRVVCLVVSHDWFYHEGTAYSESFKRECLRCGRAEASFIFIHKSVS